MAMHRRHPTDFFLRHPGDGLRRTRRRLGLVTAALFALASAACAPGEPPFRVGLPPWVPAQFALITGDLQPLHDGEVQFVEYSSPIELARHFREGNLDAAALPLDFAPYWGASIPSLDVVFVLDVSQGADDLVAAPATGDLPALLHRRVGLEASPLAAHLLLRALKAGGLGVRDVETVSLDTEDQAEAFRSGKVDAVVTREPDRSRLLADGATSLFDSSRIPGQVVDVLFVRPGAVTERADVLHKLVEAWLTAYARLEQDRSATLAQLASELSLEVGSVEQALRGVRLGDLAINRQMLSGPSPALGSTLVDIQTMAIGAGLLSPNPPGRVRFHDSFLPRIAPRPLAAASGVATR
jgi:NitT/TauT family transport system substrate-binding protein